MGAADRQQVATTAIEKPIVLARYRPLARRAALHPEVESATGFCDAQALDCAGDKFVAKLTDSVEKHLDGNRLSLELPPFSTTSTPCATVRAAMVPHHLRRLAAQLSHNCHAVEK